MKRQNYSAFLWGRSGCFFHGCGDRFCLVFVRSRRYDRMNPFSDGLPAAAGDSHRKVVSSRNNMEMQQSISYAVVIHRACYIVGGCFHRVGSSAHSDTYPCGA